MYDPVFDSDAQEPEAAAGEFTISDSGQQASYSDGMRRDTTEGKPNFDLMLPEGVSYEETLLYRVAMHYTRGGQKYGDRNWEQSSTPDSLQHHRSALWRHFVKFMTDVQDGEDHAAAIVWNVNAILLTQRNIARKQPDSQGLELPLLVPCDSCGERNRVFGQTLCADCFAVANGTYHMHLDSLTQKMRRAPRDFPFSGEQVTAEPVTTSLREQLRIARLDRDHYASLLNDLRSQLAKDHDRPKDADGS